MKRLYLFRAILSKDVGLIRANNIDEACDLVVEHYGQPVEIKLVPVKFKLFIPFWVGED